MNSPRGDGTRPIFTKSPEGFLLGATNEVENWVLNLSYKNKDQIQYALQWPPPPLFINLMDPSRNSYFIIILIMEHFSLFLIRIFFLL